MNQPDSRLASRTERLTSSPVRDILHALGRPGMISFAGGLPSPDSFPSLENVSIPKAWMQYGASEGDTLVREWIASELKIRGLDCPAEQVMVVSGSQQGIDLVAKLLVEPGRLIALESPSYLAAIQVFSLFGADYHPFDAQQPETLAAMDKLSLTYVVPSFQNPTGHCYNASQRQALADACDANGSILFEDDPYRELYYEEGLCRTPICSLLKKSSWVYQSSFSKTLAPGLRLGFLAASADLFPWLVKLKQAADLHSSRVSQFLVHSLHHDPSFQQRQHELRDAYRLKRDTFQQILGAHFGDIAEWQIPAGGLFFWLKLHSDKSIDTRALLAQSLEQNVAFMPGEPFFVGEPPAQSCIRLNFSHASSEQMATGLHKLSELISKVDR